MMNVQMDTNADALLRINFNVTMTRLLSVCTIDVGRFGRSESQYDEEYSEVESKRKDREKLRKCTMMWLPLSTSQKVSTPQNLWKGHPP